MKRRTVQGKKRRDRKAGSKPKGKSKYALKLIRQGRRKADDK